MGCHGVYGESSDEKVSSNETVIYPYFTFILKSRYHEGRFIIFEEDRYWNGHINAFHASHHLSKALLGSKLHEYIVADLGLGIYDAYQITQIKKAPEYEIHRGVDQFESVVSSHRERWIDGARERWIFKTIQPETTLSVLYDKVRLNSRNIRLRDLRKPVRKTEIQAQEQSKSKPPSKPIQVNQVDAEQTRSINILEISELKLGMAIREQNLDLITVALRDAQIVLDTIEPKFHDLPRCKALQSRIAEAEKWIERS
jgi:hypothetical protein